MGLIKLVAGAIGAASGAFNTTTQNAWVDYFESGDMSNGIIMKRGNKIVGKNSMNKGGDDNIITSGSGIDVQENQCMILVENGAIVDFCAEPGRYRFDSSTAPSLMSGNNKGLKALAASFGSQFLAGGQRTSTQRVYYINLGEIQGFKWGSGNINFDHWETDWNTGKPCWHIATTLMGNGVYSIQVTDPAKFYSVLGAAKAGADGDGLVTRQDIEPQIKTEAIAAIRQGVGRLSGRRIGYQEIAAHEYDLAQEVDRILDQSWEERGISIFKIAIGMMDADDKSKEQITRYQETKGYATDPSMLGAYMGIGNTNARRLYGHRQYTGDAGGGSQYERRCQRICGDGNGRIRRNGNADQSAHAERSPAAGCDTAGSADQGSTGRRMDMHMRPVQYRELLPELRYQEAGSSTGCILPELREQVRGSRESAEVLPELRNEALICGSL